MIGPVTLGDLAHANKLLWVYCRECGRERVHPLSLSLPVKTPVPSVGKRMVCSACGSRKVDAKPELHPGGIVAMRERRQ
jgi:hypothetical protein